MTSQHPITPPPELVQQWVSEYASHRPELPEQVYVATRAAQWGADQELEACCEWIAVYQGLEHPELLIELLRVARRPKPPSLTEQALEAWERQMSCYEETDPDMNTIRRALEKLQELEGGNG